MPTDFSLKAMNAVHRGFLKLTGGKVGWRASDMPVLRLTTIGRKSGQPKVTPLNYQAVDGAYVVVASKGGYADHPLWYKNLDANPDVEVQAGKARFKARARTAKGEERARLWDVMRRAYPPYDDYQAAAGAREIPVVVLEPAG